MSPAQDLADRLIGTCDNCDPCEELGDDIVAIEEFDQLCFECSECGWWCSTDELNNEDGDNRCDECFEGSGDD